MATAVGGERVREPMVDSKEWLLDNFTPIGLVVYVLLGATMVGRSLDLLS